MTLNDYLQTPEGATAIFNLLTYKYTKVSDVLDIPESFVPVASVTHTNAPLGVYSIGLSVTGTMGDTTDQAMIRFRTNGGAWSEFRREAKDTDDTAEWFYMFPFEQTTGDITIELEARKEAGGSTYDILFADVFIQLVG